MRRYIYGDDVGYVEIFDATPPIMNEQRRIRFVADIASLSHGRGEARDPYRLWERLKSLGHNSVFEFVRFPREYYGRIIGHTIRDSLRHKDIGYTSMGSVNRDVFIHRSSIVLFKVKVPIFVARQIMRHRGASYLEMSRRYTKGKLEFYIPTSMRQDREVVDYISKAEQLYYKLMEENKLPAEVARTILPVNLYTTFYMMMDFESFRNFVVERFSRYAQLQTREVARAMIELIYLYQREFLGLWFTTIPDRKKVNIYELIGSTHSYTLDYGDPTHHVVFKDGMFYNKIYKEVL